MSSAHLFQHVSPINRNTIFFFAAGWIKSRSSEEITLPLVALRREDDFNSEQNSDAELIPDKLEDNECVNDKRKINLIPLHKLYIQMNE